jgi:hypothetical protein
MLTVEIVSCRIFSFQLTHKPLRQIEVDSAVFAMKQSQIARIYGRARRFLNDTSCVAKSAWNDADVANEILLCDDKCDKYGHVFSRDANRAYVLSADASSQISRICMCACWKKVMYF